MGLSGTVIIYGIIGVVVAAAMLLREPSPSAGRAAFLLGAGVLFWPLFAPVLLGQKAEAGAPRSASPPGASSVTRGPAARGNTASAFDPKIQAAEAQLLDALSRVKGAAGEAMADEAQRVRELSRGLSAMAARLAEIDEALASPELGEGAARAALAALSARGEGAEDPRAKSLTARLRSIELLKEMRRRTLEDLERALFKMEEISAQMRILKFAGRPPAEVAEQLREIEGCVEGVTEAWLSVA